MASNFSTTLGYMGIEDAEAEVIRRECQFLDPEVRRRPEILRSLLHPEFVEFGASGRVWDAQSTIDALTSEQDSYEITGTDFRTLRLAPGAILLTFKTRTLERVCLRSSIWILDDGNQWRLRFHQGTVTTE
jgi:hypothetical protein